MKSPTFHLAQRDDFHDLSLWLVEMSQRPEQHCLHSWSDQDAASLQGQLLGYWDDSELCYVMALQDGQLVGAMGSEYDEELQRAWLHGPHASTQDWNALALELYKRLLAELPDCIEQMDAFLNVENKRGGNFYAGLGFKERGNRSYEFWLAPGDRVVSGERGCSQIDKEHHVSFKQLYAELFPGAYYSGERLLRMVGQSHKVLVIAEGKEVLGFTVVCVEKEAAGEIQFFGVRQDRRRQGYGRRLLLSAIDWLLDTAQVERVTLNVGEELVDARGLYESVGFRLQYVGIGLRKSLAT